MIHSRAIISSEVEMGDNVNIGPWTQVSGKVQIGANVDIANNVSINGTTKIGDNCSIFPFASVGSDPQDKKYSNDKKSFLEIGYNNIIRECVTINRGTAIGGGLTKIGNNNLLMAYVHIAHDCIVGNNVIFSNNATLAGHVTTDDYVILSGFSGAHQFCHIGRYSFLGMRCTVAKDILPYVLVAGAEPSCRGVNIEGLKRQKFSSMKIGLLRKAYKIIFRDHLTIADAISKLQLLGRGVKEIDILIKFLQNSKRGILR